MLCELTKEDWMAMLGIPETHTPRALLLWGTRNLKSRYATMRQHFDQVLEVGSPNGLIEDVFIGKLHDACVGYASAYGAPMASEIVHLFGVLGARLVVQIGTCGGFADGLKVGELFAADEAFCGEGASQYYKQNGKRVGSTLTFSDIPEDSRGRIPIRCGAIFTTSALFAESKKDIDSWAEEGFSAVDMETAATFAVAEFFGMDRGSLLSVFDNPRGDDLAQTTDTEKDARREAAQTAMVDLAISAIARQTRSASEQVGPAGTGDRPAEV